MKIVINQERLENTVTVGELLEMQSGRIEVIVSVMSKFVVGDDGEYLHPAEGEAMIKSLTIAELKQTAGDFSKKVIDNTVPPQSGEDSN